MADTLELTGNMADDGFCLDVVAQTVNKFGKVDHLVNNAFSFNATGMDSDRNVSRILYTPLPAVSKSVCGIIHAQRLLFSDAAAHAGGARRCPQSVSAI